AASSRTPSISRRPRCSRSRTWRTARRRRCRSAEPPAAADARGAGSAMNFFEHQAEARRNSKRLVLLFVLAVAAIVLAVDLVVMFALDRVASHGMRTFSPHLLYLLHPTAFYGATLATLAVIGLGTLYKTSALRSGGGAVAREFGATLVEGNTR